MAGGGVSSQLNPIESSQFTEAELRAAVEAAADWGTYVTVHAYTSQAVRRAIAAGVRCIDHGQLIDDATAQLMAEKGVRVDLQPLTYDEGGLARMQPHLSAKGVAGVCRNGKCLQDGQEVQYQDCVRRGHSFRS